MTTAARMLMKSLTIMAALAPGLALAATAKIEKIGTGSAVKVVRAGKVLELKEKDGLEPGDEITTDANTAVDLRFEDETLLRVGVNSSYRLQSDSKLGTLFHRLVNGAVRVLVKPAEGDKKEAANLKFRLNTPEGTIGVRGTEFVVITQNGKTDVKGLDGEVVFGPADADYKASPKSFVMVTRGFESSIGKGGKSARAPEKFDLKRYLDEMGMKGSPFAPLAGRVSGANKYARAAAPKADATPAPAPSMTSLGTPKPAPKAVEVPKKQAAVPAKLGEMQDLLLAAAKDGNTKAARKALNAGAYVDGTTEKGEGLTALQVALLFERDEMVKFLVKEAGADVNKRDKNGKTPLMVVAEEKLPLDYAEALVYPGGADLSLVDREGNTAADLAKQSGAKEIEEYLNSKRAQEESDRAFLERKKAKAK